jgi:hypothetical protein
MMLACTPTPNRVTRDGVVISTKAAARARELGLDGVARNLEEATTWM